MRLPLRARHIDEINLGKTPRKLQDRTGDRNIVIVGERAQDIDRGITDGRETIGKLRARLSFNFLDKPPEHIVEQVHVLVVVMAGAREEERRHALECFDALIARAALEDVVEFRDQRRGGTHLNVYKIRSNCAVPAKTQ